MAQPVATWDPRYVPTVNTTMRPTMNQTMSPTMSPTMNPTMSPTMSPTMNPVPIAAVGAGFGGAFSEEFLHNQAKQLKQQAEQLEEEARQVRMKARACHDASSPVPILVASTGLEKPPEAASQMGQGSNKPRVNHAKHTRLNHSKEVHNFTTIMLRNCPNDLKRDMLMEILDKVGFDSCYDFVYLPVDFRRVAGLGYAFVNFTTHDNALRAMDCFQGFSDWPVDSEKVSAVSWGEPLQGLKQHLDRYRNSPVMHPDVQDGFKPAFLKNGVRQPFPVPTKKLRPPRMKRNGHGVPSSCPGFADSDSEE